MIKTSTDIPIRRVIIETNHSTKYKGVSVNGDNKRFYTLIKADYYNGSDIIRSEERARDVEFFMLPPILEKEGYEFIGWVDSSQQEVPFPINTNIDNFYEQVFHARFKPKTPKAPIIEQVTSSISYYPDGSIKLYNYEFYNIYNDNNFKVKPLVSINTKGSQVILIGRIIEGHKSFFNISVNMSRMYPIEIFRYIYIYFKNDNKLSKFIKYDRETGVFISE